MAAKIGFSETIIPVECIHKPVVEPKGNVQHHQASFHAIDGSSSI